MARGGMNINVSCYTIKLAFWPWLLPHSLLKNGSREPGWMTSLCLYTTLSVKSGIIRYWVYFINLRRQRMYTSPVIIVYTSQSVSQSISRSFWSDGCGCKSRAASLSTRSIQCHQFPRFPSPAAASRKIYGKKICHINNTALIDHRQSALRRDTDIIMFDNVCWGT